MKPAGLDVAVSALQDNESASLAKGGETKTGVTRVAQAHAKNDDL